MKHRVFIGTYTRGKSEGIYYGTFESGALSIKGVQQTSNPSYITIRGNNLYAVEESKNGAAVSYAVNGLALTPTGTQRVNGDDPCHVLSDGERLYVSNYSSGSLAVFHLNGDRIEEPPSLMQHEGSSVDPNRQRSAHVHQSVITPDDKYLAVCDLGMDKVLFYPHGPYGIRVPAEEVNVPKGAGPRHAVFGRDVTWYVVCELSCDVLIYHGYGKAAKLIQTTSSLRVGETGACAALRLSPDGSWLIVSVRGANTLAMFPVLAGGLLGECRFFDTKGDWPRDAAFSPDGRYVLCALERSDAVSIFGVSETGLTYCETVTIPSPTCICFG